MSWVLVKFSDVSKLKPHVIHPQVVRARLADILERHGREPVSKVPVADLWLDVGGCVRVTDPKVTYELSPGRSVSMFCWQRSLWAETLRKAAVRLGARDWVRVSTFPDRLAYLSPADVLMLLPLLEAADPSEAASHTTDMARAVALANRAGRAA